MIEIAGKKVFSKIEELINPEYTALAIIDMQNDLVSKGGALEKWGEDVSGYKQTIDNIYSILKKAREVKLKIFHIVNICEPYFRADSPSWIRFKLKSLAPSIAGLEKISNPQEHDALLRDTWGANIIKRLTPEKDEFVIEKQKSSAFSGTNFDSLLRAHNIKSIVFVGVVTNGCVESTARESMFHDYYTVIVEDAVNNSDRELHEASLKVMSTRADIIDTSTIVET